MFAAQRGVETAVKFNEVFRQQAQAQLQSGQLARQMEEIESRTKMQLQNIYQASEKVQSAQISAFVSGGVELSGSAMSVISDTINDAAEAAYIRQRESDYDRMSIGIEKFAYDDMASNETMMLGLAAATLGGAASFGGDMARQGKGSKGGDTGSSSYSLGDIYDTKDRAGGTTGYSRAYLEM